jgi:hypothetical protein
MSLEAYADKIAYGICSSCAIARAFYYAAYRFKANNLSLYLAISRFSSLGDINPFLSSISFGCKIYSSSSSRSLIYGFGGILFSYRAATDYFPLSG